MWPKLKGPITNNNHEPITTKKEVVLTVEKNTKLQMLSEHRVLQFSLVLLVLAFALIGYMAYLNAQLREQTQVVLLDEYSKFISEQFTLARYEKSFEVRQKYYTEFMSGLQDAWFHMNRKQDVELSESLQQVAKAYYGLEPFLNPSGRHYLQKRLAQFHEATQHFADPEYSPALSLDDKSSVDAMIEDFQQYLYPLLFESKRGAANETEQAGG